MIATHESPASTKRLLFFSGGTALRETARFLARTGADTVHLITPFDSGGSSAALRRAFAMPAVGDIRNRLMALADPTLNPGLFRLLAHRLGEDADRAELDRLADGTHPLLRAVPEIERAVATARFRQFRERMPDDFDLPGASLGNLVLTAAYLNENRRLAPAIDAFAALVRARGTVRPIVDRDLHLAVRLENGQTVIGQHNITGKETAPLDSPVRDIWLTESAEDSTPARETGIGAEVAALIAGAGLICFPMGSFYSSVAANLLPDSVGRAVAANPCPKIFIPGTGLDPEAPGLNVAERAARLREFLIRSGAPADGRVLDAVLADTANEHYEGALDATAIRSMGLELMDRPLTAAHEAQTIDGEILGRLLLSMTP